MKGLEVPLALLIIFSAYRLGVAQPPPSWSVDVETKLRTSIFTGYEVLQRPSQKVNVSVSLNLLSVNDLNIKDQTITFSSYLGLFWDDSRLSWMSPINGTDYSKIKFLFSSETYVWRPALVISNAVDNMAVVSDTKVPMRISKEGRIIWNPLGIYVVSCESDITYYPLDQQECSIKLSSWAYTTSEIWLQIKSNTVDLSFYSENGEWDLQTTSAEQSADVARNGISFSALTFKLTLKRRLLFHVLNTLFPVALMAFLIPMVFKLHVDSGEKVGYALTVLLAYAVYLTMISDSIPSTSVSVCFLSLYLVLILALGTFAVLGTLLVIDVNQRDELTGAWRAIIRDVIGKIVCQTNKGCACGKKRKTTSVKVGIHDGLLEMGERPQSAGESTPVSQFSDKDEEFTGQDGAYILDRFFFLLFMFLVTVFTLIYLVMITSQY